MAAKVEITVGMIAEYTCDETWGDMAGQVLTGDVVNAGVTYVDVLWRESGRTERLHLRNRRKLAGFVFRAETDEETDALRDEFFDAGYAILYRQTERRRIEVEHDQRAELIDEGRHTSAWKRAVTAAFTARMAEVDQMVAALRPGDQVRMVDDLDGRVWTIRATRDGEDGWIWLSLHRAIEDGTEVWTGCRARAVDLVQAGTDEQNIAEREAELRDDHRIGWITEDEYATRLQQLRTGSDEKETPMTKDLDPTPEPTDSRDQPAADKPFVRVFREKGTGNVIIALDAEAMDGLLSILDAADLKDLSRNPESHGMDQDEGLLAADVGYDILGQLKKLAAYGH